MVRKKKSIMDHLENIKGHIHDVDDPDTIDRVYALLIQTNEAIRIAAANEDSQLKKFIKKDHFFPTQKNEKQLTFKKTTADPGRKKRSLSMK